MKVSIIMPCYNARKYIERAIRSIQASSIRDFEIIVYDDGSTDDTVQIAQSIDDERIRVFTRPEKGYAFTMNEALDEARGDYILNVDPDDWISPLMLERMLSEVDGCDFVKCGFWFEFKDSRERYLYEAPEETFCPRRLPPEQKMKFFASQIAIWSCMIRRSFIERHHIRLNETPGAAYQDTYFVWQINALANRVKVIQEPLYHYNKTNDNASTASSRYPLAPAVEYRRMADWCMDNPKYGIHVRQVLCRCRFGSYMWNMSRIDKEDRLAFAKMAQEDFNEDYNFIDARMFTEPEYDVFLTAMKDPAALVEMFDNIEKGVKK